MKRKRAANVGGRPPKRPKSASDQSAIATSPGIEHPVLRRLYPQVLSLRHYLLSRLPGTSKNRRRRITLLGTAPGHDSTASDAVDVELGQLLDATVVGVPGTAVAANQEDTFKARDEDVEHFSQHVLQGTGSTFKPGYFLQGEIVDFVIWLLFKRAGSKRPTHILCHGFHRGAPRQHADLRAAEFIPGIACHTRNANVERFKDPLWCRLHSLLGPGGDRIMMDLLVECGIFSSIDGHVSNYSQISGIPITDIKPEAVTTMATVPTVNTESKGTPSSNVTVRKPSTITFVRSRMFYARPALNAKGGVRFGMRHIHVLNRYSEQGNDQQTAHIMKYLFPRQFGLHNVFTSKNDARESAMLFKDYTLREKEITHAMYSETAKGGSTAAQIAKWKSRIPKRLKGEPTMLVNRLRKFNSKCSYVQLLRHYCPVETYPLSSKPDSRKYPPQPSANTHTAAKHTHQHTANEPSKSQSPTAGQTSFTDMACPTAHVSAFCRAVISRVIPNAFWGDEDNKRIIMYWIDQFVCLRKYESLTLHQVTQKLQISSLAWLRVPGRLSDTNTAETKMCQTDFSKRCEIFCEFVYWVFDGFLVPLIRSNFHVTESNVHRNRLFYFRHDVWRQLTEPCLSSIKTRLFEEIPNVGVGKGAAMRSLGYSKIRLLPKQTGVRLITNLKRRQQIMRNGQMVLGRSINSALAPVFNVITYEKTLQPDRFGSSLFSISDMFPRLDAFRTSLQAQGLADKPLYFAKVDVESCFDTIPQQRLLSMVETLLSLDAYQTGKHVELRPLGNLQRLQGDHVNPMPLRRYIPHSRAAGESTSFEVLVRDKYMGAKSNTIFVDTAAQKFESRDNLMQLLREHVERNLVKIGKKLYRQKMGIPQGSVLSSILCNFFYAELEREVLDFALGDDCLLMRLLDDFCLITTDRQRAERFIQVMHRGHPDFGVAVKAAKSVANFDIVTENGFRISKCGEGGSFPYCGVLIDTRTLEVSKNMERSGQGHMGDSLTVELAKVPGQTFHRKVLNGFKIQLQAMFIDTSFNTVPTVLANLHRSFQDTAVRCFEYLRSLSKTRPVHSQLLIRTVESIIALAYVMLQRRTRSRASRNVERVRSLISRPQVQWLACKAFEAVFRRRQTQHRALLAWARGALAAVRLSSCAERRMLEEAIAWRAGRGGG